MIEIVLPVLETEREQRLKTRSERKRKYVPDDGRRRKVYALQKFLMTLKRQSHGCRTDVWS